jgi:hypothetical protein
MGTACNHDTRESARCKIEKTLLSNELNLHENWRACNCETISYNRFNLRTGQLDPGCIYTTYCNVMKMHCDPQCTCIFPVIVTIDTTYFRKHCLSIAPSNGQHKMCSALQQATVA